MQCGYPAECLKQKAFPLSLICAAKNTECVYYFHETQMG